MARTALFGSTGGFLDSLGSSTQARGNGAGEKHGLRTALTPGGMIWVAYHKGTSGIKTDINRDTINAYAQTIGLQWVAMVAINDDWAALRLKVV